MLSAGSEAVQSAGGTVGLEANLLLDGRRVGGRVRCVGWTWRDVTSLLLPPLIESSVSARLREKVKGDSESSGRGGPVRVNSSYLL